MNEEVFVRYAVAKAAGLEQRTTAGQFASQRFGADSLVARIAQKEMILDSDAFAADADWRAAQRGFLSLVRSRSVIGRASGWRKAVFEVPTLRSTVAPVAGFVAEGQPIQVSKINLKPEKLPVSKIATVVIATDAVVKIGGPDFEAALTADLTAAIGAGECKALLDPANAGGPGVPAAITHGVVPVASTGDPAKDLAALVGSFDGDLERAVLVTTPRVALALHAAKFECAAARGGDIAGIPLITDSGVPASGGGAMMVLFDPGRILLADDGAEIDAARSATLNVGVPPDDVEPVSLWQQGLVAFIARRRIGWLPAPGSVGYVSGIDYDGARA